MPYLKCEYDMKNIKHLSSIFTVRSTNSKQQQINQIFEQNGLFYNQTVSLLNEYFDGAIAVYPTNNKQYYYS